MAAQQGEGAVGRLAIALSLGHFLAFVDRFTLAALLPVIAPRLTLDDAATGLLLGPCFALPYATAALLLSRGSVWALGGGIALWSASGAAMGFAGSFGELAAVRMGLGVGQAAFIPAAMAVVAARPGRARAAGLAMFTMASAFGRNVALVSAGGGLAALAWLGVAAAPYGWRLLCVVTILPNIVLLIVLFRWRAMVGETVAEHRSAAVPDATPATGARTMLLYLLAAMPVLAIQSLGAWLPTLMARQHGLEPAGAAMVGGIAMLIGSPLGQGLGGVMMARWPQARGRGGAALVILLALAIVPAVVAVGAGTVVAVAGITLAATMLGMSAFAGLFMVQEEIAPARRARASGAFLTVITLVGIGIGPLAAGLASGHNAGGIAGGLMIVMIAAAAAAFLLLAASRTIARASLARVGA
ncbi:MFS transporter [Sphingomonas sp.]|uniref:MFS transporter n=1 Tax=Sphingomonas sp. TaxID=28214 RepID=UPI0035B1CB51